MGLLGKWAVVLLGAAGGLGLSACSAGTAPHASSATTTTTAHLGNEAAVLTRELGDSQFAQFRSRFDATMSATVSESALEAAWDTEAVGHFGRFESQGQPIPKALDPAHPVYFVPVQLADGSVEVELAFDPNGQIAGFYIRPPGFDRTA